MMHYKGAVVTIREASSHTQLREYSHNRVGDTSEVTLFLPYGSEYEFFFKFIDGVRRRLELTIDGTLVTKGIILAGPQAVLERFVDTQKRFKFVSLDDPKVQDPTDLANGGIEVRLYKEKQRVPLAIRGWNFEPQNCSYNVNQSNIPYSGVVCDSYQGGVGATVEGSTSNQSFVETKWNGDDGLPQVFKFNLRGKDKQQVAIKCPYCETYNRSDVVICNGCGALFQR